MTTIATPSPYDNYCALFSSRRESCEFENEALSVGREFLPACALAVLDKASEPTAEYWNWLSSQVTDEESFPEDSLA